MIKKTLIAITLLGTQAIAQTEIYNEDFQAGLPVAYTIVDNDGFTPNSAVAEYTSAWIELTDPDDANDTIVGSTSYFDPVGQADRWLITPAINLGAYGNIAYWETKSHDASFPDDYIVLVSKTDVQISSFTDTLLMVYSELPDWTAHEGNLSDLGLDNETIYLAFVNRTDDGFKLYLDDIRVEMEDPSGINELESVEIKVSPNPSSDMIYITGIQSINEVNLISISGQTLQTTTSETVNISTLESGRYIIEVKNDSQVARALIIKN
jgi:hypothetical protein